MEYLNKYILNYFNFLSIEILGFNLLNYFIFLIYFIAFYLTAYLQILL